MPGMAAVVVGRSEVAVRGSRGKLEARHWRRSILRWARKVRSYEQSFCNIIIRVEVTMQKQNWG
jgi:hypothetical protein